MHLKINLKSVLVYAIYALALVTVGSALTGVPFSIGLCFAMLVCGTNIVVTPVLYCLASVISLDWVTMLLSLFEAGFLTAITLIYRKTGHKIRFEGALYLLLSLAPFVAFSRWQGIKALPITDNPYIFKSVAAAAVAIFSFFAVKSVYALLFRLFRCKLKTDELISLAILCTVAGIGLFNLTGLHAYVLIATLCIAVSVRLLKSPSAVIIACVLALPCAVMRLDFEQLTAFVLIALFALTFSELGRLAPCLAVLLSSVGYLYLLGAYTNGVTRAVIFSIAPLLCLILALLPSENKLNDLKDALQVKRVLPRDERERYREFVSEKLYRMSEVFKEIENAFVTLDEGPDDTAMKKRMLAEVKRAMCTDCKRREVCGKTKVYRGVSAMIEAGCLKGKVSFVDLTAEVTANCIDPTAVCDTVNKLLYEYRKTTLEAENARSGRKLLAGQARGIAEVLKGRAVEFCREDENYSALEKSVLSELAAMGISCPEVEIKGRPNRQVSVTTVDCKDFTPVKKCVEQVSGMRLMLKDKTVHDALKTTYFLCEPPKYDACFGVAHAIKEGEKVSGDTHTVIRINEHSFLMALSDGMGSGEYARKVSETAISLIEAFYRSEMPTDIVLDTINKLLCFNRDERFTCIDIAEIDLNTLTASFIKIGAPVGIIVRKGEIKVLESHTLPLGILDNLHPATCREQLKNNDLIVFMSDGVTGAFNGVNDLYDFLEGLKPLNPQNLADKILEAAKARISGTPDDMTVLCVRIYEKS